MSILLNLEKLEKYIRNSNNYDIPYHGRPSKKGFKLSIQGKDIEDSLYLGKHLLPYLVKKDISFKIGTLKRLNHNNKEQARKILTIYVPDDEELMSFAEEIYKKTKNYKGWHNIKTPKGYQHYAGPIFYRNDRDKEGRYIPSYKTESFYNYLTK
jgi:hypothetical protein